MNPSRHVRDLHHRLLWSRARAGHEGSLRALYRVLYDPVYGYAVRRLRIREDAEDVTSKVFHRFLDQLDRYDPDQGSVWTWVMTLTRNAVIDHWRTRQFGTEPLAPLAEVLACGGDTPLERLERAEDEKLLHTVLASEADEIREIFVLHLVEGMRHREIAEVLGLSEAAVKQRYSRTVRRLREQRTVRRATGQPAGPKEEDIAPEGAA